MLLSVVWLLGLTFVSSASATAPKFDHQLQSNGTKCYSLRVRYDWRQLSLSDKTEYIRATKCLQQLPPKSKVRPEVRSRYDEMLITHIDLTDEVHVVAQFLPWHRYYIFLHETALRQECGYKGPLPYWNWTLDADSKKPLRLAPVFDWKTGFGGDGIPGTYTIPKDPENLSSVDQYAFSKGCVESGPFVNLQLTIGPGKLFTKHCLVRNINETYRRYLTSPAIHHLMNQPDFNSFRIELEGRPITADRRVHDAGHLLVGGDMSNPYSSPSDPLFFLHHTNLDRIWWEWQQANPVKRLYEISGRAISAPPYTNITLDFPLNFKTLSAPISIREVMDIQAEPLCYTYL